MTILQIWRSVLLVEAIAVLILNAHEYTVFSPKSLKYGSPIIAYFTLHSKDAITRNLTLRSSLKTIEDAFIDGLLFIPQQPMVLITNDTIVEEGALTEIYLDISSLNLSPRVYNFTIEDSERSIFFHAPIQLKAPSSMTLVQTDKPMYKPGQNMHIRVLLMDEQLRPLNTTFNCTVSMGNLKLRRWENVRPETGLTDLTMEVANRAPCGTWEISVHTNVSKQSVKVKVMQYELPRFDVRLDAPSSILQTSRNLTVQVRAGYPYGQPVLGSLKADLFFVWPMASIQVTHLRRQITIANFSGTDTLTFYVDEAVCWPDAYFLVNVSVVEAVTDIAYNSSVQVFLAESDRKVQWMDVSSLNFRPGLPYTSYYKVSQLYRDELLHGNATLLVTTRYDDKTSVNHSYHVPLSGIVQATFNTTKVTSKLTQFAQLADDESAKSETKTISAFQVRNSNNYLKIGETKVGTFYKIHTEVSFRIISSRADVVYYFLVISNNMVLLALNRSLAQVPVVSLNLTSRHSPITTLLVYARVGEELLADSVTFNVDGLLENKISLEYSSYQVRPGSSVGLHISAQPGSVLGLASVDKSVTFLAKTNWVSYESLKAMKMELIERKASCDVLTESAVVVPVIPPDFHYAIDGTQSAGNVFAVAGFTMQTTLDVVGCENARALFNPDEASSTALFRTFFPETWLWQLIKIESSSTTVNLTAPDSITSWVTEAVALHPLLGLGIYRLPEVKVFVDLFIDLILPTSVVLGEYPELFVLVNNYSPEELNCTITLQSNDLRLISPTDASAVDAILSANSKRRFGFVVSPLKVGKAAVSARISCRNGKSDGIKRSLHVKAPGFSMTICKSDLIYLTAGSSYMSNTSLLRPNTTVPGSTKIYTSLSGDLLGKTLDSLTDLVRLPFGCGEQNMIVMAPSIFVRQYLETLNDVDPGLIRLTTDVILKGYLSQLGYLHQDQSFSAFGVQDKSGSVWLTSFVVKCFRQAKPYINETLDQKVLNGGLQFIFSRITTRGTCLEEGSVIHVEMQGGGNSDGVTLTAYCVIAMLEDDPSENYIIEMLNNHTKAIPFLESVYLSIKADPYKMSIVTYALILARSSAANQYFTRLQEMAKNEDGIKYWSYGSRGTNSLYDSPDAGPSTIEMTSYAMLSYLKMGKLADAQMIAKFLVRMRSSRGGYHNTQDTVLGLQALTKFAAFAKSTAYNASISFLTPYESFSGNINNSNFLISEMFEFSNVDGVHGVTVVANGSGSVSYSVCMDYNVGADTVKPSVSLSVSTELHPEANITIVTACAVALQAETGMSLFSIDMPSGFRPLMSKISSHPTTARLTEENAENALSIYFNSFSAAYNTCVTVPIEPVFYVRDIQPAYIRAYDYYKADLGDHKAYTPMYHALRQPMQQDEKTSTEAGKSTAGRVPLPCTYLLYLYLSAYSLKFLFY